MAIEDHPGAPDRMTVSERPDVPDDTIAAWQSIIDAVTARLRVPVGFITRVVGPELEVLLANGDGRNPYAVGQRMVIAGSGMYCERVLQTGAVLCVPNAHDESSGWAGNPFVRKHGLSSYLGFPIRWPDGELFGTLCVLERSQRDYSHHDREVLALMRDLIEGNLRMLYPV